METLSEDQLEEVKMAIFYSVFGLINDKCTILIEKIKNATIEMVHNSK